MKGLNTKSLDIFTLPLLYCTTKYKYQLIADTKFTLDPIKIDIFVEKSKVQIKKSLYNLD